MPAGWQDIRAEALRRIHAREWPPGSQIPGETELAREFGCARATVSRALGALAEEGLLERRRRAGTRVARHPRRRAQLAIPLIRQEIEARGQAFSHIVLDRARAAMPPALAAALELEPETDAAHVRTIYLADARPFAFEDRWVNLAAAPGFEAAPLDRISPNEWLVQNVAFLRGTLDYFACPASPEIARPLGCAEETALLGMERRTFGPEAPVTLVRTYFAPGHRVRLEI